MKADSDDDKRMNRIRKILGCNSDAALARHLKTHQPHISRWRRQGFPGATARLIDSMLAIISRQKREINRLGKQVKTYQKASGESKDSNKKG